MTSLPPLILRTRCTIWSTGSTSCTKLIKRRHICFALVISVDLWSIRIRVNAVRHKSQASILCCFLRLSKHEEWGEVRRQIVPVAQSIARSRLDRDVFLDFRSWKLECVVTYQIAQATVRGTYHEQKPCLVQGMFLIMQSTSRSGAISVELHQDQLWRDPSGE